MEQTNVLLVNDGSPLLTWLGGLLESRGYGVVITEERAEALAILRTRPVHLAVVHTGGRRRRHRDILSQVKLLRPQARLVVVSDKASLPMEALEIDADDYLILPARPLEVWHRVKAFLPGKASGPCRPRQSLLHPANASVLSNLVLMLLDLQRCLVSTVTGLQDLCGLPSDAAAGQAEGRMEDITSRNRQVLTSTQRVLDTFFKNNFYDLRPEEHRSPELSTDLS
jgi:DNA-binding response OmpR family regulator